jgi:hypothetical protein
MFGPSWESGFLTYCCKSYPPFCTQAGKTEVAELFPQINNLRPRRYTETRQR